MPAPPSETQVRLHNLIVCLEATADTIKILAQSVDTPFLGAISNTIQSLLKNIETVKQNKTSCIELVDQTHELLKAIILVHVKSDTSGELPPNVLNNIGRFTETLYKIHTFVEAQQNGSIVKKFFHQGEMSALLKDCKAGLQQGLDFFRVKTGNIMSDITQMQEEAERQHKEVLDMIQALSDTASSDGASAISKIYLGSYNTSDSISMLPSEPKIFYGRESELSDILELFNTGTPRIAILGAGGMGKTSLARAVVHHPEIFSRYAQHRFFVACDSAGTKVELAALIGAHLGLASGPDLTHPVVQHFSSSPPSLLILDNLETLWEPTESRGDVEEFLSLLTDVEHLTLMVQIRALLVYGAYGNIDYDAWGRKAIQSTVDSAIFTTSGTFATGVCSSNIL
ncbi:hypothetical protein MVEN_02283600 [Mycena venus]|uniref:Novel STAND NTPase 1 domain-containing protein n=1 Tax=Mycena venus TaxID=2733690 RepID=A0A8H6X557_9AGAR|nr:hypothetical protein MVEN_02283600 [Mycena venus]